MSRTEPGASEVGRGSGAEARVQGEGRGERGGEPLGGAVIRTLQVEERTEHMEGKERTEQSTVGSEALLRI